MRVALIGRTGMLLHCAELLQRRGHQIGFVATCRAEANYDVKEADFEALAGDAGVGFFNSADINAPERVAELRAAQCDLGISVNWLSIIKEPAIAAFPHGIINAHAGDLPRFRGNACPNWAILADEPHVGLCVHQMEPGALDSGPVLLRTHFPLGPNSYISDVYDWLNRQVPEQLVNAVDGLTDGSLNPKPQPSDLAQSLRCYSRRPEDARIDWRQDARAIHRVVRASSRPFAGAYSTLEEKQKVTIWRADFFEPKYPYLAVPGQIIDEAEGDPVIACGTGALRLTDVNLDDEPDASAAKLEIGRSTRRRLV